MIHFAPLLGTLLCGHCRWRRLALCIRPVPGSILLHDIGSRVAAGSLKFGFCRCGVLRCLLRKMLYLGARQAQGKDAADRCSNTETCRWNDVLRVRLHDIMIRIGYGWRCRIVAVILEIDSV